MNVMRLILKLGAIAVALAVLAPGASSAPKLGVDVANARKGIDQAVSRGYLDPEAAVADRATLTRAYSVWGKLSGQRAHELEGVIRDVAGQWRSYNRPRALTLFSMLDFNTEYLGTHGTVSSGRDVQDEEGVVYRAFPNHGLQFHPLANFAKLNSYLGANRLDEAGLLAEALVSRAVPKGDSLSWEYGFQFGSGKPPWTSGMAQAVAAQAFARAQAKLGDPVFATTARKAFRAIPGKLVQSLPQGPWIRLYSFSDLAVLNADLQALVSLEDYGTMMEDPAGINFAAQLRASAAALLPKFDTGAWSLYSLGGNESTLDYQRYVVSLLKRIGARNKDIFWTGWGDRFASYEDVAPELLPGAPSPPAYPRPLDGFRDYTAVSFTLSKISRVTIRVGSEQRTLLMGRGKRTIEMFPGKVPAGTYPVSVRAVDLAGNPAEIELPDAVVKVDTTPPVVAARLAGNKRLTWRARDAETPWIDLRLQLVGGPHNNARVVQFGKMPMRGTMRLVPKPGVWKTTLIVRDSSGNRTLVPLGLLLGRR
jgi:D-glucuronyl C5-epimerase-like protein